MFFNINCGDSDQSHHVKIRPNSPKLSSQKYLQTFSSISNSVFKDKRKVTTLGTENPRKETAVARNERESELVYYMRMCR